MHDPTRIDPTLDALRRAWEGQPDLSLPTLFGILAGQGVGWGASDVDLVAALESMAAQHPPLLPVRDDGLVDGSWLVTCDGGQTLVTLTVDCEGAGCVVVRRREREFSEGSSVKRPGQPVVWRYSGLRPAGPGRPLVIADADGIEHRLGMIDLLSAVRSSSAPTAELEGRRRIGDSSFIVRTDAGTILVERRLYFFEPGARAVECHELSWDKILTCRPGEELRVAVPGGSERGFGVVRDAFIAQ